MDECQPYFVEDDNKFNEEVKILDEQLDAINKKLSDIDTEFS